VSNLEQEKSQEQIDNLWKRFKDDGDIEAKDELLLYYNYLIKWVVWRTVPKFSNGTDYDGKMSSGMIGLVDAVNTYNLKSDVSFKAYALTRIRGEVLDHIREQDWASPNMRKEINEAYSSSEIKKNEKADNFDNKQATDSSELSIEQLHKKLCQTHMINLRNFEDTLTGADSKIIIQDRFKETPEEKLLDQEKITQLYEAIDELPEKERIIVTLFYFEGLTFSELSDILKVPEFYIEEMHKNALKKISTRLHD